MGVAVQNPGDCLKLPNPRKHPRNPCHSPNPNPNPNRKQPSRRKRSPNTSPPPRPSVGHPKAAGKNLVMGQVKILKRGEDLKESEPEKPTRLENENACPYLCSDHRSSQIRPDESKAGSDKVLPASFYAGSAFVTSPPPSSVPLPAFFSKKIVAALEEDVATSALRRLLRLDL